MKPQDELELSTNFLYDQKAIGVFDVFCHRVVQPNKTFGERFQNPFLLFTLALTSAQKKEDFNTRLNFEIMSVNSGETFDPKEESTIGSFEFFFQVSQVKF